MTNDLLLVLNHGVADFDQLPLNLMGKSTQCLQDQLMGKATEPMISHFNSRLLKIGF